MGKSGKTDPGVKGCSGPSLQETGVCSWATPNSKRRETATSRFQFRAQASGRDLPFLLLATRIPAPPGTLKKGTGDRKLELRRLMGLFIGAGGCLFWMPYKHPRYLQASHFPSLPLPPAWAALSRLGWGPGLGGTQGHKKVHAREEGRSLGSSSSPKSG